MEDSDGDHEEAVKPSGCLPWLRKPAGENRRTRESTLRAALTGLACNGANQRSSEDQQTGQYRPPEAPALQPVDSSGSTKAGCATGCILLEPISCPHDRASNSSMLAACSDPLAISASPAMCSPLGTPPPSAPLPVIDSPTLRAACQRVSNSATNLRPPSHPQFTQSRPAASPLGPSQSQQGPPAPTQYPQRKPQQRQHMIIGVPQQADTGTPSTSGCPTPPVMVPPRNSLSCSSINLAASGPLSMQGDTQTGVHSEPVPVSQQHRESIFSELDPRAHSSPNSEQHDRLLFASRSADSVLPTAPGPSAPQQSSSWSRPPGCDLVISEPETADTWQDTVLLGMLFDSSLVLGPGSSDELGPELSLVRPRPPDAGRRSLEKRRDSGPELSTPGTSERLPTMAAGGGCRSGFSGSSGSSGSASGGSGSSQGPGIDLGAPGSFKSSSSNSKVRVVSIAGTPHVLVSDSTAASERSRDGAAGAAGSQPLLPWSAAAAAAAVAAHGQGGISSWPCVSASEVKEAVGGMAGAAAAAAAAAAAQLPGGSSSQGHRSSGTKRTVVMMRPLSGMSSQDLVSIAEDEEEDG